ncbi:PREDICTED: acidic repeat-containing protein [Nanorana parkeri]|uniref:acidic repeat-containing protein n=1 Tax=Nanorana parkeri TaxID=125878 RepID=UPI0008544ABA|nr:PREDICTED: acidic repeat-containing protein [Nanorana parkeri]
MAVESRSLLERISARIGEARPGTRNPVGGGPVQGVLSPDYDGDDSPRLPPCSLDLSDSEEEKSSQQSGCNQKKSPAWRREPGNTPIILSPLYGKNKHFSFPEEKPRSSVKISDSSDEDFENFLIQLKTPKQPKSKTQDKQSGSIKSFIVESEDEDDFDSMFSKAGKGSERRNGKCEVPMMEFSVVLPCPASSLSCVFSVLRLLCPASSLSCVFSVLRLLCPAIKSFIVESEDEDDFDSMFSKAGKGSERRNGTKTSVLVPSISQKPSGSWQRNDSPVFISDSDEDSIVIRSTWSNRHAKNRNPKDKGQRASSAPKKVPEIHPEPPNTQSSGGPERPIRPEPALCTPVSSDDEFECLMDRIKNRAKNQTPGSTARKGNPKTFLAEPLKAPCLDLTNKKSDAKPRPQSCSDVFKSPHVIPDKAVKKHFDDVETSRPGNTGVPCKVKDCFLNNLSHPTSGYVKEFKQKKVDLTRRLYSLYNRTIFDEKLPSNLEILWNKKMRKTAGYCVTGQTKLPTVQRYARIELSEKVCDSADRLRDTLIHEICHAATWLINGVRDGHGQYWRFYARKATVVHPELPMVTRCHTYEINYKFTYECSRCKNTIGRHSKSLDTERFVCALCKGKLVLQAATRKDGSPATTQLTPFAKFVKENYGSAKKEMIGMSHAEVMRKLSTNFSTKTKISD